MAENRLPIQINSVGFSQSSPLSTYNIVIEYLVPELGMHGTLALSQYKLEGVRDERSPQVVCDIAHLGVNSQDAKRILHLWIDQFFPDD